MSIVLPVGDVVGTPAFTIRFDLRQAPRWHSFPTVGSFNTQAQASISLRRGPQQHGIEADISEIDYAPCDPSVQLRDLLAQIARGSRAAFARFYDLTRRRIAGVVIRCLRDYAQSQEVTQDIYLEIWQNANRFDAAKGTAISWAMTIAHRRAVDRVRSSQSDRNRDIAIGLRDRDIEFDSVYETVEVSVEHARVIRALSVLSRIQREAVTLAYFDGLGYAEISDRLGLSVSTVKTRLRDALIKLRVELDAGAVDVAA